MKQNTINNKMWDMLSKAAEESKALSDNSEKA